MFHQKDSEIFVPDGLPVAAALGRTTHLAVGAHQDDIEFMALQGILECFGRTDRWFCGTIVTDGAGSPRNGIYSDCTDEDMMRIRRAEQKKAANVGDYGSCVLLAHPSARVKDPIESSVVEDLRKVLLATRPTVVYTHNPADKHDTHVATFLRLLAAIRSLPSQDRPSKFLGCEVWRSLDWLCDTEKVADDIGGHPNLGVALSSVFDSQITGGKRYDSAVAGRRLANATFFESHQVDATQALAFSLDMTPLIQDEALDPTRFILDRIRNFEEEVTSRVSRLTRTDSNSV
jgi:LmbE family N-acetylglucosaminyl deacetylase